MTRYKTIQNPSKSAGNVVQSCITSVSFPDNLTDFETMIEKNDWQGQGRSTTDLDILLTNQAIEGWTAPRWLTVGDVIFFYCTKNAATRSKRLFRQLTNYGYENEAFADALETLERNTIHTSRFAGTIFAFGRIANPAYTDSEISGHFASRTFAPVEKISILDIPLSADVFADFVRIGQGVITPLYGKQALGIRNLLAKDNRPPKFLTNAAFGDEGFRSVSESNWLNVSCNPSARFLCEMQLRIYFLDYLLNSLKEPRSKVLQECVCERKGKETGRVDYMIQIENQWVPVEAKLHARTESNLLLQIQKYINIDTFIPTQGERRTERFSTSRTQKICLVMDQNGIYPTVRGQFSQGCNQENPMWRRTDINPNSIADIRKWVIQNC